MLIGKPFALTANYYLLCLDMGYLKLLSGDNFTRNSATLRTKKQRGIDFKVNVTIIATSPGIHNFYVECGPFSYSPL